MVCIQCGVKSWQVHTDPWPGDLPPTPSWTILLHTLCSIVYGQWTMSWLIYIVLGPSTLYLVHVYFFQLVYIVFLISFKYIRSLSFVGRRKVRREGPKLGRFEDKKPRNLFRAWWELSRFASLVLSELNPISKNIVKAFMCLIAL